MFIRTRNQSALVPGALAPGVKGKQPANAALETFIDDRPVSKILDIVDPEGRPSIPAEEDQRTYLDVSGIPDDLRAGRNCTLCLEERTASCATDCGHMFCWDCIVGWAREKVRGPFCYISIKLIMIVCRRSVRCVDSRLVWHTSYRFIIYNLFVSFRGDEKNMVHLKKNNARKALGTGLYDLLD